MTAPGTTASFVWLAGQREPEPQVWHEPLVGCADLHVRVLARHPLAEHEAKLTVDQLARLYPLPSAGPEAPDELAPAPIAPRPNPPVPAEASA